MMHEQASSASNGWRQLAVYKLIGPDGRIYEASGDTVVQARRKCEYLAGLRR